MNTNVTNMNANVSNMNGNVASQTPNRVKQVLRFILMAIPGSFLVGICGPLIVEAGTRRHDIFLCGGLGVLFVLGTVLLLHGTRTTNEPLFLLMFLPIAVFIPFGYIFDYSNTQLFTSAPFIGFITPTVAYPLLSHYYRKRAMKAAAAETTATVTEPVAHDQH